jgi:opacity protein-like surface antigen
LRKYLLAAAAAAAIATPAVARDGSGYVGVEGGILFPKDSDVDFAGTYAYSEGGTYDFVASYKTDYKKGYDLDLIAGYDLGMIRLEGELAYKRARHKSYDNAVLVATSSEGDTFTYGPYDADADGKTTVLSAMANALLDFGNEDGLSFYIGGGAGWASTKYRVSIDDPAVEDEFSVDLSGTAKDSGFAWQAIAGVRYAISPNMDVGLKYRYFRGNKVKESADFDTGDVSGTFDANTRFKSHSLLASLIFNFGAAAPPPPPPPVEAPPPPPPPPPATQTCPDGSVILATEACPAPPPPPPPPPPAPERG